MDKRIEEILNKEEKRQNENIELIASENYVSDSVMKLQGSIFTNKYAEGYPGKRYYGGCENVDEIENLAIEYLQKIFGCKYANVQPHSGSSANMAVYRSLLNHHDKVLGMNLNQSITQIIIITEVFIPCARTICWLLPVALIAEPSSVPKNQYVISETTITTKIPTISTTYMTNIRTASAALSALSLIALSLSSVSEILAAFNLTSSLRSL